MVGLAYDRLERILKEEFAPYWRHCLSSFLKGLGNTREARKTAITM
jgi:hypothetical protein